MSSLRYWRSKFPHHEVHELQKKLYPWGLPTGAKVSDDLLRRLKPAQKKWDQYVRGIQEAAKDEIELEAAAEKAGQAANSFLKLMRLKDIRFWVELNARLVGAENSLYGRRASEDTGLRKAVIRLAYEKPELRDHLLPLVKQARSDGGLPVYLENHREFEYAVEKAYSMGMESAAMGGGKRDNPFRYKPYKDAWLDGFRG